MGSVASLGREVPFPAVSAPALLVIGHAGRNEASVREHIAELAAIGIAPPPQVPMVYELDADLLTTTTHLPAPGPRTSGEVEPVLVRAAGTWHLALGSDHTDRELEASDVRNSKAACPKPVALLSSSSTSTPSEVASTPPGTLSRCPALSTTSPTSAALLAS